MEKNRKNSKNSKIAILLGVFIFAAAAGVSYAYLTSQDDAENTVDVSKVDIEIHEEYTPPDDPEPGTVISKAPRVHSNSDVDCYVRMRFVFTNDMENMCEPVKTNSGWALKEDGYYYWHEALGPGADTGTLFDTVTIREDIDAEDLEPFDILVYAESVQAKSLTADAAWAAMDSGNE